MKLTFDLLVRIVDGLNRNDRGVTTVTAIPAFASDPQFWLPSKRRLPGSQVQPQVDRLIELLREERDYPSVRPNSHDFLVKFAQAETYHAEEDWLVGIAMFHINVLYLADVDFLDPPDEDKIAESMFLGSMGMAITADGRLELARRFLHFVHEEGRAYRKRRSKAGRLPADRKSQ